ncbi:MAG: hypothetical protein QOE02_3165 [Rhodospirillaceae bacterium]|jgi:hypothetical protein|nr:hypothetical protein [Rhodospirillaceae bacterium]MEA2846468.1 hypothetical protein [Rhodospirillaceae bacterium]MEA2853146.1 hypothetical protein [Rhodospirillaceae bacterium]
MDRPGRRTGASAAHEWRERTAPKQDEQPDWRALEEASERARLADVGECAKALHEWPPKKD